MVEDVVVLEEVISEGELLQQWGDSRRPGGVGVAGAPGPTTTNPGPRHPRLPDITTPGTSPSSFVIPCEGPKAGCTGLAPLWRLTMRKTRL